MTDFPISTHTFCRLSGTLVERHPNGAITLRTRGSRVTITLEYDAASASEVAAALVFQSDASTAERLVKSEQAAREAA
jgi:hypothetical protein